MSLEITDLGEDNIFGTQDDTSLFYNTYSATTAAWVYNTNAGEDAIVTLGNTLRFAYGAVSTGSGNATVGNFLDAVSFGVGVGESQPVPEPASLLGLLVFGTLGASSLKRK
ncbi:MAG: PEP-CTERM sorting domain-containing protein [Cyanobacteria bacterium SBLK]|nr:PEP-CTERM sorting domain-containing protein [Cyanobacteria bacterium SBLK]